MSLQTNLSLNVCESQKNYLNNSNLLKFAKMLKQRKYSMLKTKKNLTYLPPPSPPPDFSKYIHLLTVNILGVFFLFLTIVY